MIDATGTAWAIIPARGGSKGIPRKNLQMVGGRPLVVRAAEAAKGARCVARCFVSTDDSDIAAVATAAGAELIERPPELSGDTVSSEAVLLHALEALERRQERLPELMVFVQCTSPFVSAADIDGTVQALVASGSDTAHTVSAFHGFLWRRTADDRAEAVGHDAAKRLRRQDREPEFLETGAVYAMRVDGFRAAGSRFFGRTAVYDVPCSRALEIDDPEDLALARVLAPLVDGPARAAFIPSPLGGIVFDFDGVFTDNRVLVDESGAEAVWCSRSDGMGIEMLRAARVPMAVLSKERNPVVAARCRKLGLACVQGVDDKLGALHGIAESMGTEIGKLVYLGNDVNDLACLQAVGLGVAVADAHPLVCARSGLVLTSLGGRGAIRELAEIILASAASPA